VVAHQSCFLPFFHREQIINRYKTRNAIAP
jgi:hypothetical protein